MATAVQITPAPTHTLTIAAGDVAAWRTAVTALERIARKAPQRNTLPILTAIAVGPSAFPGRCHVRATDLTTEMGYWLPGTLDGPICVGARGLRDALAMEGPITFEAGPERVEAYAPGGTLILDAWTAEEFPDPPGFMGDVSFGVQGKVLRAALARVAPAMSSDSSRGVFHAACLDVRPDSMTVAASDGCRLHLAEVALDADAKAGQYLLPASAVGYLAAFLPDAEITVCHDAASNVLSFSYPYFVCYVCLRSDPYLKYVGVFPLSLTAWASLPARGLLDAAKALMEKENTYGQGFIEVKQEDGRIVVSSRYGRRELAAICTGHASDHAFGINGAYLVDFLKPLGKGVVTITIPDSATQGHLFSEQGSNYKALIMPITRPK